MFSSNFSSWRLTRSESTRIHQAVHETSSKWERLCSSYSSVGIYLCTWILDLFIIRNGIVSLSNSVKQSGLKKREWCKILSQWLGKLGTFFNYFFWYYFDKLFLLFVFFKLTNHLEKLKLDKDLISIYIYKQVW